MVTARRSGGQHSSRLSPRGNGLPDSAGGRPVPGPAAWDSREGRDSGHVLTCGGVSGSQAFLLHGQVSRDFAGRSCCHDSYKPQVVFRKQHQVGHLDGQEEPHQRSHRRRAWARPQTGPLPSGDQEARKWRLQGAAHLRWVRIECWSALPSHSSWVTGILTPQSPANTTPHLGSCKRGPCSVGVCS